MKAVYERVGIPDHSSSVYYFERKEEKFAPFWHFHPEVELTFVAKGKGIRYVGNSIAPYAEGDLVLLGENIPHQWVSSQDQNHEFHHAFVFQFKADLFKKFTSLNEFGKLFKRAKFGLHFPSVPAKLISKIMSYSSLDDISKHIVFLQILQKLIDLPTQKSLSNQIFSGSKSGDKASKVTKYILDNIDRKLTVEELANFANLQPESFCRWFKKQVGSSFITFVNRARVESAFQLLHQTDLNISQIAYQSGFETLAHFNRTFKKIKNQTPREVRLNFINSNLR
jgi:AraC-like DNA-binding protein